MAKEKLIISRKEAIDEANKRIYKLEKENKKLNKELKESNKIIKNMEENADEFARDIKKKVQGNVEKRLKNQEKRLDNLEKQLSTCQVCNKKFKNKTALWNHIRVHRNEVEKLRKELKNWKDEYFKLNMKKTIKQKN